MWSLSLARGSCGRPCGAVAWAPLASLSRSCSRSLASRAVPSRPRDPLRAVREVEVSREWTKDSKRCGALGMKCGMTQGWTPWGQQIPLTVVEIQDLQVVQVKTPEREGISALQLGGGWAKRKYFLRKPHGLTRIGHFSSRQISLK